jgi:ABC-2 type transport system permease protein
LYSQGASALTIWAGKLVGIWGVVNLFVFPLFLVSSLFLIFSGNSSAEDIIRFMWIAISLLVFYGIFIHLSLFVSAKVNRSNTALIILLGIWIFSTLVMPRASTHIAKSLYPTPSKSEFNEKLQYDLANGVDGHDPYNKFSVEYREKILKDYGVEKVEELPFNFSGHMLQVGEEHEAVIYNQQFSKLADIQNNQLRVYTASSVLSPTLLSRLFFMSMAKTDLSSHQDFAKEAEDYRLALMRELNKDIEVNAPLGQTYIAEASLFSSSINFNYTPPALNDTWSNAWPFALYLLLWFSLSLLLSKRSGANLKVLSE